MTRTSSQANRERVAAALAKWFDEGAKKKPKRNGPKYTKKRIESQPKLGIK
jgi:preprotein translocase subunit Sec61beta